MNLDVIYYECHITIEPVFDERLELFKTLCEPLRFKVAKLLMEKEPSTKDSFCTAHDSNVEALIVRMRRLVESLRANGFEVYRNKIEAVVLDERFTHRRRRASITRDTSHDDGVEHSE